MPLIELPGFVGPSGKTRSFAFDTEETINWIVETADAGVPKAASFMYRRPGLIPYAQTYNGPIRGVFYQDGRCFCVSGDGFYEIFASQNTLQRGVVSENDNPATFACNGPAGHQVMVTSGGLGYIFDLNDNTFTQITDDAFRLPTVMCAFVDGYFLSLQGSSNTFQSSDPLDGLSWNGLEVAQVSESSNLIQTMINNHREVWLLGTKTTEIWNNVGTGSPPFAPIGGTFVEQGTIAPFSAARIDNTIVFLSGDERGANMVFKMDGYAPRRISTHAIETYLNRLGATQNAIGFSYQEEGHAFYLLYLPSADTTLVWDASTGLWAKWAQWNAQTISWEPYMGRCHAYAFGKHLIGSRLNGIVYESSLDQQEDWINA